MRKAKTKQVRSGALSAGEGRRAIIVMAALTGLFFLAAFVTAGSYLSNERQAMGSVSKVTPLQPTEGGEAASRVAAIVLETDKKGRCEERRFDNRTGKMVSTTYVNCDARLEPERDTTPSENINRERIRAILGAFKR
ncbi:MAG TPA: hypothetical protein VFB29_03935 [Pseudolabrys sp.]|nr:hypothetical protein [Pseudolabrys sp.]